MVLLIIIQEEKKEKEYNELKNKIEIEKVNNKNEFEAQSEYLKGLIEGYKKNRS